MTYFEPNPLPFDITVRVGCSLAYEVAGSASLLLNLQPAESARNEVVFQALSLGNDLIDNAFVDSHGNLVHRVRLQPGSNLFRHDAIVRVSSRPDNYDLPDKTPLQPAEIPSELLRYTLPSRYCDSDKLIDFAWQNFGQVDHGWPRAQAISKWVHENIEYRYMSGQADLSAWDVLQRGFGVCRDFAHLVVALNRAFNVPTRYVTGHLPDIGFPEPDGHMDFHAYAEVYLGGHWHTIDARFNVPRIGRVKLSCGQDAVDGAFSTIFGGAALTYFDVWAYQVPRDTVGVGDPIDLSLRLDNQYLVVRDPLPPS
ncbi:transglutaminase family protein [Pelagicoccus sp. SDUM812005]|uniref:transglutaminase-like domain-containing protein n=1 Tax=Pelagicoccus sp. SDUM812005 TaxID=3041257 RepID=UPI00280E49AE|nr:transglutaminase family protein [Pelagicoccus sp. SDUM812005]MDQ8179869.1 transglutaminase family protein [Pelagicoccus sp. SDUM812005]